MGSTTETTQGKAGEQSAEAGRAVGRLDTLSADAMSQMGDLSNVAAGNFELTPEQMQYLQQVQGAAGDMGRIQMEENMETATRGVEDTAIGRTMTGGSFEAIQTALLGQQQLRDANRQSIQQEGATAQNMINMPLQYGQAQIQGNQALLARLVGGTGQTLNYDATMRGLNASKTVTKDESFGSQVAGLAGQLGSAYLSGGLSLLKPGQEDPTTDDGNTIYDDQNVNV